LKKKKRDNVETDYIRGAFKETGQTENYKKRRDNSEVNFVQGTFKGMSLKRIEPLTENQKKVFDAYRQGRNILCHGVAGTGKSFTLLWLALDELLRANQTNKTQIIIVRSIVPTKDVGFLPGSLDEKISVYKEPYVAIFSQLFGRDDAYHILENKKIIRFLSTSFVRGLNIDNAIVIVDECQNLDFHQNDSIITRIGKNSRICFAGDILQADLTRESELDGVEDFLDILDEMKDDFTCVEFGIEDIVRSDFVRRYIETKLRLGYA
jgi:phosphate starvation-inducible protein PhoH